MDIEDAFTEGPITMYDTNVEGEEESALRDMILRVYQAQEVNWSEKTLDISMLCFVAGRTYQADLGEPEIALSLPVGLWKEFLQYMVQRGGS